jgi:hypothetical protein
MIASPDLHIQSPGRLEDRPTMVVGASLDLQGEGMNGRSPLAFLPCGPSARTDLCCRGTGWRNHAGLGRSALLYGACLKNH